MEEELEDLNMKLREAIRSMERAKVFLLNLFTLVQPHGYS